MTVSDIVKQVREVLQDASGKSWSDPQIARWIYDAELAVAFARPDALSVVASLPLVAGTRQSLDNLPGGSSAPNRLLDVSCNLDGNGDAGTALRLVSRGDLDAVDPGWRQGSQVVEVLEYMFDERDPRGLLVSPPSDGTGYLEVVYSAIPAAYGSDLKTQSLNVKTVYVPAIIDWALYRCFSRNSEMTPNGQRGQAHLQTFFNVMGVKANSDTAVSLKQRTHLNS